MYDQTLVLASGMCAFCTFQWLINILVWLLGIFHFVLRDWGLAIIALVVLVRLILHPITKRSQVSMMNMSKMGPEMERLKKKYADDKDELNKQMMKFYKEQGTGPLLGCLPLFLQMPIWIALWSALQSTFELRQAPFLWGFTWIDDLSRPDALISFHPIPLPFGFHIDALNVLPILMAIVTWMNQKYTPQAMAATPEQEQQQKMMKWMTLIFPLMFYNMPSGLNLYYVTSMALGIFESKRIRDHIKQREEAEKEGKVIVDAGKKMKKKKKGDDDKHSRLAQPDKPQGWLGRKMAEFQARMEEIQRQAEKPRKGK
jgi:YidC/Oxa1 family membrane protein insertase